MKRRLARWKECRRTSAGGQPRAASLSFPEGPLPSLPSRYKREYAVPLPPFSRSFLSPLAHSAIQLVSPSLSSVDRSPFVARRERSHARRPRDCSGCWYHPEPHLSHTQLIQPSFPIFAAAFLIRVYPRASGPRSPYLRDRDSLPPSLSSLHPMFPSLSLSPFPSSRHATPARQRRYPWADTGDARASLHLRSTLRALLSHRLERTMPSPAVLSQPLLLPLALTECFSFSSRCRALERSQLSPSFFRVLGFSLSSSWLCTTYRGCSERIPSRCTPMYTACYCLYFLIDIYANDTPGARRLDGSCAHVFTRALRVTWGRVGSLLRHIKIGRFCGRRRASHDTTPACARASAVYADG